MNINLCSRNNCQTTIVHKLCAQKKKLKLMTMNSCSKERLLFPTNSRFNSKWHFLGYTDLAALNQI